MATIEQIVKLVNELGFEAGVEKEKQRVLFFLHEKIESHVGCRGLVDSCVSCIGYRQVIEFVESDLDA